MDSALVLGVIEGLTIGFLAVGIALIYKANRFINLAHAQIGTYSAVLLAKMVMEWGWSWWVAFVFAIAVGVATALLVERFVIRPLRERSTSTVTLLLATIGVAQLLSALTFVPRIGPNTEMLTLHGYPLPFHTHFTVGGVVMSAQFILILVLVPLVVTALAAFLKYTTLGKMIRAVASNPDAARLSGISVSRVSMVTWGIAGALSAVTAVLQAPSQQSFDASALGPDLLLRALGAAALGGFISIPAALIGGLGLGFIEQITLYYTSSGGLADVMVFVAILVVLVLRSKAITAALPQGGMFEKRRPIRVPALVAHRNYVRHQFRLLGLLALFVAVLLPVLPYFRPEAQRSSLNLVLIYAVIGVALTMLVGWAGQVSLGHFAVVGVGAYLTAKLSTHHWSIPVVLILAGVVGAAVMVVIGLPALRIRGLTLAVTTLGFAVLAPSWLFNQSWFASAEQFGVDVQPLGLFGLGQPRDQLPIYYIGLVVLVLVLLAASGLRRSLPGRMVMAVRDNELAARTFGVTPATVKLGILGVSGFIAATAGVLWADATHTLAIYQFNPLYSLGILAIPVIGGLGSLGGAIAAAALLYGATYFLGPHFSFLFGAAGQQIGFQLAAAGLLLVGTLLAYPSGLAGYAQERWERFLQREADAEATRLAPDDADALIVQDIQRNFGGVRALDFASITVHPGEIVGLIGPNGAGKSTLLNAVSGALSADGSVHIYGTDVSGMAPDLRWVHGLGRSFQDARLFPSLTVSDTIQLALRTEDRVGLLAALLRFPWAGLLERRTRAQAAEIIDRFGLQPWADALVSDLSTGTRRVCDLAAQVAAGPRLLLLDEPTAGVAQREAEVFPPLLRRIRDELGCAILIVEHDLPLLMNLCDRIYAMESGRVIAEGTPEEVRNNPAVIASYLGTNEAAVRRSGSRRAAPVKAAPQTRRPVKKSAARQRPAGAPP